MPKGGGVPGGWGRIVARDCFLREDLPPNLGTLKLFFYFRGIRKRLTATPRHEKKADKWKYSLLLPRSHHQRTRNDGR